MAEMNATLRDFGCKSSGSFRSPTPIYFACVAPVAAALNVVSFLQQINTASGST